ncbi:MAG TPA: hypothetical protein VKB18_11470 [Gemmatimonadota bacterium]|nr:hypothetical protein [Gemmatimonadota bacterium]
MEPSDVKSAATATYLLLVRDAPPEVYDALTPEERSESMRRWNAWVDSMARETMREPGSA